MAEDGFHDFVRELFAGMGRVEIRRMFGGAGVYADGLMFALLAEGAIHIKANDAAMREMLAAHGSGPFVWSPQNGPRKGEKIDLGYWRLPDRALDDADEAVKWGRLSLALAKTKASAKTKTRSRAEPKPKTAPKKKTKARPRAKAGAKSKAAAKAKKS
jgi:DNA transformation protein